MIIYLSAPEKCFIRATTATPALGALYSHLLSFAKDTRKRGPEQRVSEQTRDTFVGGELKEYLEVRGCHAIPVGGIALHWEQISLG